MRSFVAWTLAWAAVVALVVIGACVATRATAEPLQPLASLRGKLGGAATSVTVGRDGMVRIAIDGRPAATASLAAAVIEKAAIEKATITAVTVEDHQVVWVRAPLGHGRAAELVWVLGDPAPIVSLVTGPVGDGGRSDHLTADDAGLVRYQTSAGMVRCDGEDRLYPERWDFVERRFRPVEIEAPAGQALPALAVTTMPRPIGIFHFTAASSDASADGRADRIAAPRELEDGSPETRWRPTVTRGAWVTARAHGDGQRLRDVVLSAPEGNMPRAIALVLGGAPGTAPRIYAATLPRAARVHIAVPLGPPTACVSVVIAEPGADLAGPSGRGALAEISLLSDADLGGGLATLVAELARGGAGAAAAALVLEHAGTAAAVAIAEALPTAVGPGRRRMIELLAALGGEPAAHALGSALGTATAEERPIARAGLVRLGEAGAREAARLYAAGDQSEEARTDGALVLEALIRADRSVARLAASSLLAGAGSGSAALRHAARDALAAAAAEPDVARAVASALAADETGDLDPDHRRARLVDLARALGHGGLSHDAALDELRAGALSGAYAHAPADAFELRYQLLRAMGELGHATAEPVLSGVLAGEPDEVLRATAIEAARALGPVAMPLLDRAARDPAPRVRRAALPGLADPTLWGRALEGDRWPIVRRAAAELLGKDACHALGWLERAAFGEGHAAPDTSEEVRRAALTSLGRCSSLGVHDLERGLSPNVPTAIRELTLQLVATRGGAEAAHLIARTLSEVMSAPDDDPRALGLAVSCLRGLGRTRVTDRSVLEVLGAASNDPASEALRAAAMQTIGALCPQGAKVALDRGRADPDGTVRRAAEQAARTCHR